MMITCEDVNGADGHDTGAYDQISDSQAHDEQIGYLYTKKINKIVCNLIDTIAKYHKIKQFGKKTDDWL